MPISLRVWVLVAWSILFCRSLAALDPHRSLAQYLRYNWSTEIGFNEGQISSIAQTPDGCLWIGGDRGLVRFDGVGFRPVQESSKGQPITHVLGLATDGEGGLWIWMQGANILRYANGVFENAISDMGLPNEVVTAMAETADGGVLLATIGQQAFKYRNGTLKKIVSLRLPSSLILTVAATADGTAWLGTSDNGLISVVRGDAQLARMSGLPKKVNILLAGSGNSLWAGTDDGLYLLKDAKSGVVQPVKSLRHQEVLALAQDHDANLWVGTARGVFRLQSNSIDDTQLFQGETDLIPSAIFQDREGDLWMSAGGALERWRDGVFTKSAASTSIGGGGAVLASDERRLWFAPAGGGLQWIKDGHIGQVDLPGPSVDVVYAIAGRGTDIWIGRRRGGLTHLNRKGTAAQATYTSKDGLAQDSIYSVLETRDGSVWAGTVSGGLSRLQNGVFRTFTTADGLASNTITALDEDEVHTLCVASPEGLNTYRDGQWQTLRQSDGLPSDEVTSLQHGEGQNGTMWVGTAKGLALLAHGHIRTFPELAPYLRQTVLGLALDRSGFIWIQTSDQVLRFNTKELLSGSLQPSGVRSFTQADGLVPIAGTRRTRSLDVDTGGNVWITSRAGLFTAAPQAFEDRSPPSIVGMNGLAADGRDIPLQRAVIEAPPHRLTLRFSAVSLPVPERVRYRYRLEGFDQDWSDASSVREAVYTRLEPGKYRFRLMATDSDGAWNGAEFSFPFTIKPAFWQTVWFRACSCLLLLMVARWIYLIRMQQIAKSMNLRFEERLAERMRIAQDLHDTLLQGFLSASMQLDVASDFVPSESAASPMLARVLALMQRVMVDTRQSVSNLRTPEHMSRNLEAELLHIPKELEREGAVDYHVTVSGLVRTLEPACSHDIFLIGREAVLNAYRHAQAKRIDVDVIYDSALFRLTIRDDGRGIDGHVLQQGREGHWGLIGMRERATAIGARLRLLSKPSLGTELELIVPGHLAYSRPYGRRSWWTFRSSPPQ